MDRVRIGIVGIGNIALLNVPGYLENEFCDVVALCDPRREKAERMAREWGVEKVYDDLDALLRDPEIDAVEILTPTYMHRDHVIAAARAGKHISCQKPMANSVAEAREMLAEVAAAGVTFRVTECAMHYGPLAEARRLIREGAIGEPTVVRIKTVVGKTETKFQDGLEAKGFEWRFNEQSPGGHLFDDVIHKFAAALFLVDTDVRRVQAVVRQGEIFFEAPTAALWEYERDNLLGLMEVSYAPDMYIRSEYYGADEFFEIQGTSGFIWVTRYTGTMLDLPPLILYTGDGKSTTFSHIDASWANSFKASSSHFIDALDRRRAARHDRGVGHQSAPVVLRRLPGIQHRSASGAGRHRNVRLAPMVAPVPR